MLSKIAHIRPASWAEFVVERVGARSRDDPAMDFNKRRMDSERNAAAAKEAAARRALGPQITEDLCSW